ncbi:hypothetical protein BgiMline_031395 [Biomphalaria glabrata]|nr:hypothetical protein BgiMline_019630 [Biomphalaria glabrata]
MSRVAETDRNGIHILLRYNGEDYEYLLQESHFSSSTFKVKDLISKILSELKESQLNQILVIKKEDNTELVMNGESLLSLYHETLQESVYVEIRSQTINCGTSS